MNTLAKIILFPVYVPYSLYKKATEKKLPEGVEMQARNDTAMHLMQSGIEPEAAFRLSRQFWEKNKNKLSEVLNY
jgi:hypothetical protein